MRLLVATMLFCGVVAAASEPTVLATLFSDGSTNTWTQADLQSALQLTNRKYHRDMAKASGRIDWHGPVVRRVVETNDLKLVEYHEDGYCHTNRWTSPATVSPAARSRQLAAETARRQRELAEARRKAARRAELQTNFEAQVSATMAAKHWPEPLAREYLRYELQQLAGTNTVTITTEVR